MIICLKGLLGNKIFQKEAYVRLIKGESVSKNEGERRRPGTFHLEHLELKSNGDLIAFRDMGSKPTTWVPDLSVCLWFIPGEQAALANSRRYPSPAELDAYAQKTSDSPLSIKIYPTNVRVPQHKHLSRSVNGFDTSGLRYGSYAHFHSGGYRGLLAIAKPNPAPAAKGVLKNPEGRRTKVSPVQVAVAPYPLPGNAAATHRHRQAGYPAAPQKPLEVPVATVPAARGLAPPSQSGLPPIQNFIYHINQHCQSQAPGPGVLAATGASASPSLQIAAVAAVARPSVPPVGFAVGEGPQDGLAFTGAVLPAQGAEMAKAGAYVDGIDYILWQQKQQQQVALQMYSTGSGGGGTISRSPKTCIPGGGTQGSTRPYLIGGGAITGGGLDRLSSSPLNCTAMHGNFSVGQYFPPPWNSVLATPDSDCYNPQELAGAGVGSAREQALPLHAPAGCSGGPCCPLPTKGLCVGSTLRSSLQSLEFLISGIRPPCIKEQMLGKGYETVGVPRLLDQQQAHIRLPVYR